MANNLPIIAHTVTTTILSTPYGPVSSNAGSTIDNGSAKQQTQTSYIANPPSRFLKPLTKVSLSSKQVANGTKFSLPYNPEELTVTIPTSMGEYAGVQHYPSLYYAGLKCDVMDIKFFAVDRVVGVAGTFAQVAQYALPTTNGNKNGFAAPPVTYLNYGALGTFKGFVVSPSMQIVQQAPDLCPLQAYISFQFHVLKYVAASALGSSDPDDNGASEYGTYQDGTAAG
jgi:hypothetical protein